MGEYCIRMFNEPPEFRPELEEGEIDEMLESEYGIDVEEAYNTSDTDSSMPELVEEMSEDEENIPQTDHEANMMRLWRLDQDMRSGPITSEILQRVVTEVEFGLRHYTLQE